MRQYQFLGVNLAVSGTEPLLEAMHARLRYFPGAAGPPDAHFEFHALNGAAADPVGRPLGQSRALRPPDDGFHVEYFPAGDQIYMSYGQRIRAVCDFGTATVRVSIREPEAENLWLATHPIFVVPLFEMLKRRGYFNVHAGAMSLSGRGLLIAGHSTAGKSTLVVALCRAGFGFMSDDYVFLSRTNDELRALGFTEELDLLDGTISMFPELGGMLNTEKRPGWTKRQVRVEDHWDAAIVRECVPAVIVFPSVHQAATSTFEAIDASEAVAALVPNIQFTRPDAAQAHLDVLGELVRKCGCYRLRTGQDLDALPMRLREIVEAHRSEGPADLAVLRRH